MARVLVSKPRILTIYHSTMGDHRQRVEARGGGNGESPRHHRGKAGAKLDELALVDISYASGRMSEFGAIGQGCHLCYMQVIPETGGACTITTITTITI